jgi:ribosomal protein S18 acetylase RimI-like enzyme
MLHSATLSDLHEVASWIATAQDTALWAGWRVPFPIDRERLPQAIEFSEENSFCLRHEDRLVAFGQIIGKQDRAHLARLIVAPSVRGKGHGKALVRGLLKRIRQAPFERVSLNVDASNLPAVTLYLGLGFRDAPRPADEPAAAGTRYMERATSVEADTNERA